MHRRQDLNFCLSNEFSVLALMANSCRNAQVFGIHGRKRLFSVQERAEQSLKNLDLSPMNLAWITQTPGSPAVLQAAIRTTRGDTSADCLCVSCMCWHVLFLHLSWTCSELSLRKKEKDKRLVMLNPVGIEWSERHKRRRGWVPAAFLPLDDCFLIWWICSWTMTDTASFLQGFAGAK